MTFSRLVHVPAIFPLYLVSLLLCHTSLLYLDKNASSRTAVSLSDLLFYRRNLLLYLYYFMHESAEEEQFRVRRNGSLGS